MKEIERIRAMGVAIICNYRVNDVVAEKDAGHFDAVFLAVGAEVANHLDIPSMDGGKMIDALELLEQVEQGQRTQAWPRRRDRRRGQHRGRRGAGRAAAWRRGSDSDLSLRPQAHAGTPRRSERGVRRRREGQMDVDGEAVRQRRNHRRRNADAARREGNDRHRQIRAPENGFARARGRGARGRRVS